MLQFVDPAAAELQKRAKWLDEQGDRRLGRPRGSEVGDDVGGRDRQAGWDASDAEVDPAGRADRHADGRLGRRNRQGDDHSLRSAVA